MVAGWRIVHSTVKQAAIDLFMGERDAWHLKQGIALVIDKHHSTADRHTIRIGAEIRDLFFQTLRKTDVIGIDTGEKFAAGQFGGAIRRGGYADVCLANETEA